MSKSLDEIDALLHCPFCGGEAFLANTPTIFVTCTGCLVTQFQQPTEAEAVAAWNRRDDAAARERDRLREALHKIADAPAWGAPERFDVTPAEVRILARAALEARHDAR